MGIWVGNNLIHETHQTNYVTSPRRRILDGFYGMVIGSVLTGFFGAYFDAWFATRQPGKEAGAYQANDKSATTVSPSAAIVPPPEYVLEIVHD